MIGIDICVGIAPEKMHLLYGRNPVLLTAVLSYFCLKGRRSAPAVAMFLHVRVHNVLPFDRTLQLSGIIYVWLNMLAGRAAIEMPLTINSYRTGCCWVV